MSLAAFEDALLSPLRGLSGDQHTEYRYMKNISWYNDFIRLVIANWILDGFVDLLVAKARSLANERASENNMHSTGFEPQ